MGLFKKKKDLAEIERDLAGINEGFAKELEEDKQRLANGEISKKTYEKAQRAKHKIVFGD